MVLIYFFIKTGYARFYLLLVDARAMKTINFQLSSQKCIDEGYVIRPPSPLIDQEYVANPFQIEPMEWFAADHHADVEGFDGEDDEAIFSPKDKVGEVEV